MGQLQEVLEGLPFSQSDSISFLILHFKRLISKMPKYIPLSQTLANFYGPALCGRKNMAEEKAKKACILNPVTTMKDDRIQMHV
ncbi:hypothetical protein HZS_5805 [Henneguya salminicola]|nr:hypothetical protein HZS_5805 [Henneguya salminicola]